MATETLATKPEKAAQKTEQVAHEGARAAAASFAQATASGDKIMKDAMDRAQSLGDQAFKDGMEKSLTALNELNAQSKRNLEAVVASVTAATKGAEALSTQAMTYTKSAMEHQVEQARALTGARSVQEVVELQTTFAKSAMESYIAQMNHAAETLSAAVKDSFRPLNERATAMVETLQSAR
jgi:phasin family protein